MASRNTKADGGPTTPSDGYRTKPTSSAGKSVRLMSASAVADMLDVNRGTVRRWKTEGMPVVGEPEGEGDGYKIDLADVVKWLIERAVEKAVDRLKDKAAAAAGGPEPPSSLGYETEEEANRRRAIALANIAEMDEEIKAGTVVPIEAVEDIIRAEHAAARAKLENVGATLAGRTARMSDPSQIKDLADSLLSEVMRSWVGDLSVLMAGDDE